MHDAIQQISDNAAEEQTQGDLPQTMVVLEVTPPVPQGDHGNGRKHGQPVVVVPEDAPSRPSVAPVHQFEEPLEDCLFGPEFHPTHHHPFGQLVQTKNGDSKTHGEAVR